MLKQVLFLTTAFAIAAAVPAGANAAVSNVKPAVAAGKSVQPTLVADSGKSTSDTSKAKPKKKSTKKKTKKKPASS